MKTAYLYQTIALVILGMGLSDCKKEDKPVLSTAYAGTVVYKYTRGFPSFAVTSTLEVILDQDGVLTSGAYEPDAFDKEQIKYEGNEPVMKIHFQGDITLKQAKGEYKEIDGEGKVLVYLRSVIEGTLDIYAYDDDLGFILVSTQDFEYIDEFSDGTMEFDLDDAVWGGSTVQVTVPDIEGTSTYSYTLFLTPSL